MGCLFSGALLPLAFSPYDYYFIAILSLAYLFYVVANSTLKGAGFSGYVFGLGMFGIGINWLHISINFFGGISLLGAWVITCMLVAFLALYPTLFACVYQRLFVKHGIGFCIIAMPTLWVLLEWLRSWAFTGFPWLSIGYSQIDTLISAVAPLLGVYGVSWVTAFLSASLAAFFLLLRKVGIDKKKMCTMGIVWTGLFCIVWFILNLLSNVQWTMEKSEGVEVVMVQGAIPQTLKWQPEQRERTLELYLSLSTKYPTSELIIWPETAIPVFYHQAEDIILEMTSRAKEQRYDYLVGLPFKDHQSDKFYNGITVIGSTNDTYYKRHLVPFGEYLPLDRWLRPVTNLLGIPMPNFSAGADHKPIVRAANEMIGVSICYEDIFGAEIIQALPEAKILVNISNDAWFGHSIAPHQHLQMARMRALETGRYMLRSTNTGISAIINEKGLIIARSPQFIPHAINLRVRLFSGMTPYVKFGNSLVVVFALLLLVMALFFRIRFSEQ